ncbi:hypothetical protein L6J37_12455 [Photobacterium sp. WH77]|uniref:Lipoprotein n=1 Tax=Photobacterium arenosum TaxID=2774143 RepID=A0ABR9BG44_9GAMM|nr:MULTISPECIES: hypothetical protein [Photobacterium]MBD8511422.1 hypothetical protein [Photobacterium arenosum]MBV7263079.1 hypothetical protein [Photobacterium sp. WH24]MCG2837642.1 hypothetical protein [Photobacterium sp. WH77]MCG2845258.1 hypothetical protein [Photobacterium sp. WH80]MDO6583057.1 hypothetical protein [Photobacterium sp. 2_MG-2023]
MKKALSIILLSSLSGCASMGQPDPEIGFESTVNLNGYYFSESNGNVLENGQLVKKKTYAYIKFNSLEENQLTYIVATSPAVNGIVRGDAISTRVTSNYSVDNNHSDQGYRISFYQQKGNMHLDYVLNADINGVIEDFTFQPL